jgi:HD-GYP domain-containing protein (c-di-GMP phosphodiesterase class II)
MTIARPGMILALEVAHPQRPDHVLLKPGFALDAMALARLRELGVHQIWIRVPGLQQMLRFVSPELLAEHQALTARMARSFDVIAGAGDTPLDFREVTQAVRSMVARLAAEPRCQSLASEVVSPTSPLAAHASNVCFLSLLMGLKLDEYLMRERGKLAPAHARNVESLGVAALLHDVGALRLPAGVLDRVLRTGDETDPAWREHVQAGHAMARDHVEPSAAAAILQHHQRFDGKGYPALRQRDGTLATLAGHNIHVFARIIHVADAYDRLRMVRGQPAPTPAVRVLRVLLERARAGEIDPVVFKALLNVAPPFRTGELVTLSNGLHAAVVGQNWAYPCRPDVQIIPDQALQGRSVPLGGVIRLQQHAALSVMAVGGERVTADLFSPMNAEEFDLRILSDPRGIKASAKPEAKPAAPNGTQPGAKLPAKPASQGAQAAHAVPRGKSTRETVGIAKGR